MISEEEKLAVVKMFCAYCRKTLRNARTDIIRKQAREARWETVFSDMHESELNRLASPDDLISEEVVFEVVGREVVVMDTVLADAIHGLSKGDQAIVLLYYFADAIGSREIGGVKPSDAKEWAQRMKSKGFAYSTISNHKRSLKAAFYLAIADDCIRKNPFDFKLATVIKRDVTEREPLSREQVDALLGFMRSDAVYHRYTDEVVILLGTGLRISEMCGLTETDIDLTNRVIFVDHQLARAVGGGYRVDEPKTESGKRYIYMTDEVMAAFEHVVASRPKAKPMSVDGRTGFIFLNRDGLPRVGGDYDRVFRGLRRKYAKGGGAPLPEDMTPHTLRHTFCTEMAKAGMNPKALQYIMGHKDIKMTLGYYAHMDGCTAAEEMRRVAV